MNPSDTEPESRTAYASLKISGKCSWTNFFSDVTKSMLLKEQMQGSIAFEDAGHYARLLWYSKIGQPHRFRVASGDIRA